MGMAVTGSPHDKAEINMTPMIDVLLVLIILFMVITPLTPSGLRTLPPQPAQPGREHRVRLTDIVVTVGKEGLVLVNGERVSLSGLPDRLKRIFQGRGDEVIFVRGDKELEFRRIAEVIDVAKGAGLQRVGLMTD
jgi:biopolymer transport protein ExbD